MKQAVHFALFLTDVEKNIKQGEIASKKLVVPSTDELARQKNNFEALENDINKPIETREIHLPLQRNEEAVVDKNREKVVLNENNDKGPSINKT